MRKKKLTYRERWLKEHPKLVFYLDKKTYKYLNELESIKGIHKKDILLNFLNQNLKIYEEERDKIKTIIKNEVIKELFENPIEFYFLYKTLYKVEPIFIGTKCVICKEPIILTHRDTEIRQLIEKILKKAEYHHVECYEKAKKRII
jgi:hypothetical protein